MGERNPYDPPRRFSVGRLVFYVVASLIILFLVVVLFNVVLSRKNGEPPSVFGYSVFIVTSDSMEPTMTPGAALLVREADPASLRLDDVITYQEGTNSEGKLLVDSHRIVEILEQDGKLLFRTKGDNREEPDEALRSEEQILGRAVSSMPAVGRFFAFVKTPVGLVACIAVPLVILLAFEIVNLIRLSRKSRREEELSEEEEAVELGPLATAVKRKRALQEGREEGGILPASEDFSSGVHSQRGGPIHPELPPLEAKAASYLVEPAEVPLVSASLPKPVQQSWQPINTDLYGVSVPPKEPGGGVKGIQELNLMQDSWQKPPITPGSTHQSIPLNSNVEAALPAWPVAPGRGGTVEEGEAELAPQGKDRFQIEGIEVKVRPDELNLSLLNDLQPRDISISVTGDGTSVVVGSGTSEVRFTFSQEETSQGRKVTIRKKGRGKETC